MTQEAFKPEQLEVYRETGHELIPLHSPETLSPAGKPLGKAPLKGWRGSRALSVHEAQDHMVRGGNVGVRLRGSDLIVDVDPRNFANGDDPVVRLEADLRISFMHFPHVITGSGGRHIYMSKPANLALRDTLEEYQGVEFKAFGRQVVAPGSVHPNTRKPYVWDPDPLAPALLEQKGAPEGLLEIARRPLAAVAAKPGRHTADDLQEMLSALDVERFGSHDEWLKLMMAAHHATSGEGREEWIAWSVSDPRYADDRWMIGYRWDSLSVDGARKVTERTLYRALLEVGRADLLPRNAADFSTGSELRSNAVDDWVWVAEAKAFVRRRDGKKYGPDQWKSLHANLKPEGDVLSAVWKGAIRVRKYEALVYIPCADEFPDGESGGRYNIWRDSGIKPEAGDVGPFLEHMEYLFADTAERGHVLDYLALLVQRPDMKVHFALLVKGRQGTGKSWLGQLMTKLVGEQNVVVPSNDEVTSRWTGWTEGAQLAVIEELMTVGRRDVANRLKPIITDPRLRIENKGFGLYSIPNHLNLLCFTNHEDALPIEQGDRRWLVVFSEAVPRAQDYYGVLFDFLEEGGPAAVKDWLLKRNVTLNPKGIAPSTRGKDEMRRLSQGEAEALLLDMFEEGSGPFEFDIVRLEDVLDAVPEAIQRRTKGLRNNVIRFLLDELRAEKLSRYTKGGRRSWQLWAVRNQDDWRERGAAACIDAYTARHDLGEAVDK